MSKVLDFFKNLLHRNDPLVPVDPLPPDVPVIPTPQADLLNGIRDNLNAVIAHYKDLSKDGFTLVEVWDLATSAIASIVHVVEQFGESGDAADKKAVVMLAAGIFYDEVIAPLDIPYVPEFVESRIVDPALKSIFLKLASGAADAILKVFNRSGVFASSNRGFGAPAFKPY